MVGAEAVEGADQAAADDYADGEADEGPRPDLEEEEISVLGHQMGLTR